MTNKNKSGLSLSERILLGLVILLSVHVGLSSLGFIPSEVSDFNQQVKEAVRELHTIEYAQKKSSQLSQTENAITTSTPTLPEAPDTTSKPVGVRPTRVKIPAIDIDAQISNPTSTDVSTLDAALKDGVVRYPGSGRIDGTKPMFLFGHSSRLPVVQNEAYKSFNGLENLSVGDTITVMAEKKKAEYRVGSVRVVDKDEAYIDFTRDKNALTISTCTTFGAKENRVVVTARRS